MTTTEDNKDQGALNVVAQRLCIDHGSQALSWQARAARILSALAEAGYTVVKTGETHWEYGQVSGCRADAHCHAAHIDTADDGQLIHYAHVSSSSHRRRMFFGPWEPVPEGGEQ